MHIHWLQHVPFEGLGSIESWLLEKDFEISVTRLYAGEKPPDIDQIDWLIIMGGPMNIYQEAEYPWLIEEKLCIKRAIKAGRKVLGICLGAQLIAHVLQARVYANSQREIGWFNVELTTNGENSPLFKGISRKFEAFHWHGDTFGLPGEVLHLASSQACTHQAFIFQDRVAGLQFHLETTQQSARALVDNCGDELITGGTFVQGSEQLLADEHRFKQLNAVMTQLLENMSSV